MISGEGLDMNCYDEVLTTSYRKDSPLQLYNSMQLKQDIEWSFNDKDDAKDSTQLYCCKIY